MAMALGRLADYESASEELADICAELEQLQAQELPDLLERQKRLQEGAEAAGRLGCRHRAGQQGPGAHPAAP